MITKLEQDYMIRAFDVDLNGTWRPSAILTRMQEIAEDHAIAVGFGRAYLVETMEMAWMLTRLHLQMKRYPALNENIKVITWPSKPTKLYFIRHTLFLDESGAELGRATSLWVMFNIKERYLCRTGDIGANYPYDPDNGIALPEPTKIRMPDSMDFECTRHVAYSETDMNAHMNNAKYADWCCELFDADTLKKKQLRDLRINFIAEAYLGEPVDLYRSKDGDGCLVCGKRDGKTVFDASLTWEERKGGSNE